jgi:RNA polymerase-binding transcription factor DksA
MTDDIDAEAARERLERERQRVTGLIAGLRDEGLDEEEASQTGELTHYDQHPADQASETFEREKDLSILEGLESDLAEIEAALQRVDEGTYGVDEVTGEPIDPERLEAIPTARTNVDTTRE